jgi:carboxylate-amine ligase
MNTAIKTASTEVESLNQKPESRTTVPSRNVPVRWLDWAKPLRAMLPWGKNSRALAAAAEEIRFKPNGFLTLGVEIEMNLVDAEGHLQNRAEEVLKAGSALKKLKPEFRLDVLEVNTGICQDVHAAESDLKSSFASLAAITDGMGIQFTSTGSHPKANFHESKIWPDPRYQAQVNRFGRLIMRAHIMGLHVHLGVNSAQECIRYNNFFMHFIPHFLALSASSPFWQGEDSGLAASRPSAYESIPTAGQPLPMQSWAEFEELYWSMKNAGAIEGLKDIWWDIRPSPRYGTIEIRVCDGVATLKETLAITAFIHLLAHWFNDHLGWLDQMSRPGQWVTRENKWRAMRYGLEACLITSGEGTCKMLRDDIHDWLKKLEPYAETLGYREHIHTLRQILERGNSATRQRAIYGKTGSLDEVVKFNMREFKAGAPLWDEATVKQQAPAQEQPKAIEAKPQAAVA